MQAKNCSSLEEIRQEIDKVDDEIIKLIAKRNSYIKQAALFKHTIEEVKDKERIEFVLIALEQRQLSLEYLQTWRQSFIIL